jgi:DNA-binding transcriptional ArsR family regulator
MLNYDPKLDLVFQALADPSRRAIVERLALGEASVSALAEPLNMSLPGVMQHIRLLEESGLVRTEKVGRVRTCRMDAEMLSRAQAWMEERRRTWEGHFDRLGAYLADQQQKEATS